MDAYFDESIELNMDDLSVGEAKKNYRTLLKAGEVASMPDKLATITNTEYKNALGLYSDENAHLQFFINSGNLKCVDGQFMINGLPASSSDLKELFTDHINAPANLTLARVLFSIILQNNKEKIENNLPLSPVTTVYIPKLLNYVGKTNIGRNEVLSLINGILEFQSCMGIVNGDILPVLVYMGEDQSKNTLSFSSPYINRLLGKIYKSSIQTSKNGRALLKNNGKPQTKPSYSYLVKPSIYNERNKKAVEIVFIIIPLIEQAGNHEPHISAKTIAERNVLLKEALDKASPSDKNKILKRTFTKAWELLRTQTEIETAYPGIELPDPMDKKNIPTASTLEKTIFTFKHNGKQHEDTEH